MPNLQSVTFDLRIYVPGFTTLLESPKVYVPATNPVVLEELAKSAAAWSRVMRSIDGQKHSVEFRYSPMIVSPGEEMPKLDHAFIAVNEEIPSILISFFTKMLKLTAKYPIDLSATGLSNSFFESHGLKLAFSSAFTNMNDNGWVVRTYQRRTVRRAKVRSAELASMIQELPLRYLRIGGRHLDSSSLLEIPLVSHSLANLDVTFTDTDPYQVIRYLENVKDRCKRLYTFSIHVSPLHDRSPDDDADERFFEREDVDAETAQRWRPFWQKLDEIAAGSVIVWEGEGPGFRRSR